MPTCLAYTIRMRYFYFEACGYVSQPFEVASIDAAEAHVLATFRSPDNAGFDGDDGGIIGLVDGWWECLVTFVGDTAHNPANADRLAAAISALVGPTAPTPGGP